LGSGNNSQLESNVMDFQANVLPQQRISNPKRGKKGEGRNQQVDIRKMRDEYALEDGANFDLKLPNNTFNKLFSPPQNLTEED
jgi:hypothetical protein